MIDIKDKKNCCGCSACAQRCPKQCITMQADNEGFLYPNVNTKECINCGLCNKVCPTANQKESKKPLKVYAAFNNNSDVRLQSSSGGVFSLLAEKTINDGGVVFGVKFDKSWMPVFDYTERIEGITEFRGSKYVQANIGNIYQKVEEFLKADRKVLFSGTPCQIAGLNLYLRKEYANLLTVDMICHGTPSPKVWNMYLEEFCSRVSCNNQTDQDDTVPPRNIIESINFRHKSPCWNNYSICITNKVNTPQYCIKANKDPYMLAFLLNITLRPSCYDCPAKEGKSHSDIKLCDFWGIENLMPDYGVEKGVGGMMVYTSKGIEAFPLKKVTKKEFLLDDIVKYNPSYDKSSIKPSCRTVFFKKLDKCDNVIEFIEKYTRASLTHRFKRRVKGYLSSIKRHICKK